MLNRYCKCRFNCWRRRCLWNWRSRWVSSRRRHHGWWRNMRSSRRRLHHWGHSLLRSRGHCWRRCGRSSCCTGTQGGVALIHLGGARGRIALSAPLPFGTPARVATSIIGGVCPGGLSGLVLRNRRTRLWPTLITKVGFWRLACRVFFVRPYSTRLRFWSQREHYFLFRFFSMISYLGTRDTAGARSRIALSTTHRRRWLDLASFENRASDRTRWFLDLHRDKRTCWGLRFCFGRRNRSYTR